MTNGTADVLGVSRAVIEHFSRRRQEILDRMAERGETSARAGQIATLETRKRKQYGVPVDRLRHGLARRLGAIELHGVRRQREKWDRAALRELRDGSLYRAHERLRGAHDARSIRA